MHADDPSAPAAPLRLWVSKVLDVTAELGVADLLRDGPRTSDGRAGACGAHPPTAYRLLRALASGGVFSEAPRRLLALTPLAELPRSDGPGSMRALARMYGSEQYRAWDVLGSVRTGAPAFNRAFGANYFDYLAENPEASTVSNEAMTSWTTQVADAVVAAY